MDKRFKLHLMNEAADYLNQQVGDILNALQSLEEDSSQMGNRQLISAAKGIASQIRKIVHDTWPDSDLKVLRKLQKVGVALLKGIDSNDDLREVVTNSVQELQTVLDKAQAPVNDLASQDDDR